MRKLALILALLASAVIVSYAQSREEIYDLSGYVYSPTFDLNVYENGHIIRKTFDVKSVYLEYVDDNFAGFTLMSDDNEKAEFSVVRWISKIFDYRFWVDNIQDYYVVVAKSGGRVAVEFMSAAYETSICCFFFNRRPTEEELEQKRKEEQERQRIEQFMTEEREAEIREKMRMKAVDYYRSKYALFEREIGVYSRYGLGERTFDMSYKACAYIDFINVEILTLDVVSDDVMSALESAYTPNSYEIGGRKYVKYGDRYVTQYEIELGVPVQYGGKIKIRKTNSECKFYRSNVSTERVDMYIPEIVLDKVGETVVKKGTYFLDYFVIYGEVVKFVVTDKKGNEYYSFK